MSQDPQRTCVCPVDEAKGAIVHWPDCPDFQFFGPNIRLVTILPAARAATLSDYVPKRDDQRIIEAIWGSSRTPDQDTPAPEPYSPKAYARSRYDRRHAYQQRDRARREARRAR